MKKPIKDTLDFVMHQVGWTCTRCGESGNGDIEMTAHIRKYHAGEID